MKLPPPCRLWSRRRAVFLGAAAVVAGFGFAEFQDAGNPPSVRFAGTARPVVDGRRGARLKSLPVDALILRLSVTNARRTAVVLNVQCRVDTDRETQETLLLRPVVPVRIEPGAAVDCEVNAVVRDREARVQLFWSTPFQAWVARQSGGLWARQTATDWIDVEIPPPAAVRR